MRLFHRFYVICISFWYYQQQAIATGGEKPAFEARPFEEVESFRQDVCDRALSVEAGEVELRDALRGLELRPIMGDPTYFNLDPVTGGIDTSYGGLIPVLLDELGRRAGFTWRNSFGIIQNSQGTLEGVVPPNKTWTEVVAWSVEQYDLSASWWGMNQERMNLGVSYLEPWYDSSVILIGKERPAEDNNRVNLWNWLLPYHDTVWFLVLATIVLSGFVNQWLEWMSNERDERSFRRWTSDCMYNSVLNFTQNYEYEPRNAASRLFGLSMAIWALVMTATYTANLASLLVESKTAAFSIESIEDAIVKGLPICTYKGSFSDTYIQKTYPRALLLPKPSEEENFEDLHAGKCIVVATTMETWKQFRRSRKQNPFCDLKWFGRTVMVNEAAFTAKADSGYKCTSLIHAVLTLHLVEMKAEGFINDAWDEHLSKYADIDCDAGANYVVPVEEAEEEEEVEEEEAEETTAPVTAPSPASPEPTFAPTRRGPTNSPTPEPTLETTQEATAAENFGNLTAPSVITMESTSPTSAPAGKPHGTTFEIIPPSQRKNTTFDVIPSTSTRQAPGSRRLESKRPKWEKRRLASVGGTSASVASTSVNNERESERLTINQMLGTFVLHYLLMSISMIIAVVSNLRKKYKDEWKRNALKEAMEKREEMIESIRIREEEQMGKSQESSMDQSETERGLKNNRLRRRAPAFSASTTSFLGQSSHGTAHRGTMVPRYFNQPKEALGMSDESKFSDGIGMELGDDDPLVQLKKRGLLDDKPRLKSKDARYLQKQLELAQEQLENMQAEQAQMRREVDERLQLQQDYMDQQMSLIVILLRDMKAQMRSGHSGSASPQLQIPEMMPMAAGNEIAANSGKATASTSTNATADSSEEQSRQQSSEQGGQGHGEEQHEDQDQEVDLSKPVSDGTDC